MRRLAASIMLLAVVHVPAWAGTSRIPTGTEPRPFQEAVDRAAYGDTVYVAAGDYRQAILRNGIHLVAEQGPEHTILRSVSVEHADSTTVLEGFNLLGAKAVEAVVNVEMSSLTIVNCWVSNGWSGIRAVESNLTVRDCTIRRCDNGLWFLESSGRILGNDIRNCVHGISLVSSSTVIQRNVITGNSLGIRLTEHCEPSIGGTLVTANRVYGNPGGFVQNMAKAKRNGIRTMNPATIRVPYNYWGSDCPDPSKFRGEPIEFQPWVSEAGSALTECPDSAKATN